MAVHTIASPDRHAVVVALRVAVASLLSCAIILDFFHGTKVAWYKFMLCFWKLQAILTPRGKGEGNCCQVILRGALCLVNVVMDKLSSTIPSRISGGFSVRFFWSTAYRPDHPVFIALYELSWDLLDEKRSISLFVAGEQARTRIRKNPRGGYWIIRSTWLHECLRKILAVFARPSSPDYLSPMRFKLHEIKYDSVIYNFEEMSDLCDVLCIYRSYFWSHLYSIST